MMNNLKKMIAMVIVFTMITGGMLVVVPGVGESSDAPSSAYLDVEPLYVEPEFRERKITDMSVVNLERSVDQMSLNLANGTVQPYWTVKTYWDEANGTFYDDYDLIDIEKRGEGQHCEVWVADNRSFYSSVDPRNAQVNILDWQVEYLISEFDDIIYPTMTETFIDSPSLNGSSPSLEDWRYMMDNDTLTVENVSDMLYPTNDSGKLMIVVFNIIDENWYNVAWGGGFIIGYYSPSMKSLYDRNIINVDCWDWARRLGDNVTKPNQYESTIAHEYQHLLHDEMDPEEVSWVNEGLSMMAEYLCGYDWSYDHMQEFMDYPENSLTVWGDLGGENILSDYGAVAMFFAYLHDHYGGTEMLQAVFFSEMHDIEGVDEALLDMGHNRLSFEQVFRDWRLANLILDPSVGGGLYCYKSVDMDALGSVWLMPYNVGYPQLDRSDYSGAGYLVNDMAYAYATDYLRCHNLDEANEMMKMVFDGGEFAACGWTLTEEDYLYSGTGENLIDYTASIELNLTTPLEESEYLHTLEISTYWNIETEWDFGFVQISTDGGETWTTLDDVGAYCTNLHDGGAHPDIVANLPGLTGTSVDTVDLTFDLSAYDGQEVLIGFRYMTDWGATNYGWDIYDVVVDGEAIPLESFSVNIPPEVDWIVTIYVPGNEDRTAMIIDIPSLDQTEVAVKLLASLVGYDEMYIIMSPNDGPVGFSIDITYRGENTPR